MSRWSLRSQLIVWNVVALAVLFGFMGFAVRYTVTTLLVASVNRNLEEETKSAPPPNWGKREPRHDGGGDGENVPPFFPPDEPGQDPHSFDGNREGPPPSGDRQAEQEDIYAIRHFDLQGRPLGVRPLLDSQAFATAKQGQTTFTRVIVNGLPMKVLTTPYRETSGRITAVLQVGYPLTEVERAIADLNAALLLLIPFGLLGAGAGGAFLTTWVLRQVRYTAQAAEQITISSEGGVSARLPVVGKDEFAELAAAFNALLNRLETAMQEQAHLLHLQRRFTADASHELKTPLTVIRGTATMALGETATITDYQRALQKIDTVSETMAHLVSDLLLLARSDSGQLSKSRIVLPLGDVLQQAVSRANHRGVPFQTKMDDPALTVWGNEGELVRVFTNLLDNAARYTPPSGKVHIQASATPKGVVVVVTDTGVGIAPEHLSHLGERFYRVDASRSRQDNSGGTGLGLAIAKGIVESHGGCIAFESYVGQGTTVQVTLPRVPSNTPHC